MPRTKEQKAKHAARMKEWRTENAEHWAKYRKRYDRRHRKRINASMKAWRRKNRKRINASAKRYWRANREAWQRHRREAAAKLKRDVIAVLGGCCRSCGLTDYRVLQIHHVNGDGWKERPRKGGVRQGKVWRLRLLILRNKRTRKRFELLCANCHVLAHWKEGING